MRAGPATKEINLKKGGYEAVEAIRAKRKSPKDVVASFFGALYIGEYGLAYKLLTDDTRRQFEQMGGLERFIAMVHQQGITHLDLGQALEEVVTPNEAIEGTN